MTRVEIDLNIRVRGNWTVVGIEDADAPVQVGDEVQVFEPESGVVGPGRVEEIDHRRQVIFLSVTWSALAQPEATLTARLGGLITRTRAVGVASATRAHTWPGQAVRSSGIACSA